MLAGIADEEHTLTTGVNPFNVFARIVSGKMTQKDMAASNEALAAVPGGERFLVCSNLPKNDEMWADPTPEWLGKASMSKHHRFMCYRSLGWSSFNALVFGMKDDDELAEAIEVLEAMRSAAYAFVRTDPALPWPSDLSRIGLYFHTYPHCSVNAMHLHIVDLDATGPTYDHLRYKNLLLDDCIAVLRGEFDERRRLHRMKRATLWGRGSRVNQSRHTIAASATAEGGTPADGLLGAEAEGPQTPQRVGLDWLALTEVSLRLSKAGTNDE